MNVSLKLAPDLAGAARSPDVQLMLCPDSAALFGDSQKRRKGNRGKAPGKTPRESQEQKALFRWWESWAPEDLRPLLFAIPNGGFRFKATAVSMKLQGVRRGVPDILLAAPRAPFAGLWIELKRLKGGTLSPEQKDMLARLAAVGYAAHCCKGWLEASEKIREYLGHE